MNRFIDDRKDNWQRLEDLLGMLRGSSLRGLSRLEVREFGELYRRAATDLAIARAESRDPKLVNYLNSLVIRAHGKIYRAQGEGVNLVAKFFTKDLPQTFRANLRYMVLAFGIFVFAGIFGFTATLAEHRLHAFCRPFRGRRSDQREQPLVAVLERSEPDRCELHPV